MERLKEHLASLKTRIAASVAVYAIFVVVVLVIGLRHALFRDEQMLMWMAPLVVSQLLMPQQTMPAVWPRSIDEDEQAQVDMIRATLRAWQVKVTSMRVAYIVVAAGLVAAMHFVVVP
jgi:hypothetical protein